MARIGEPTDGRTLLSIRHHPENGGCRFVFELDGDFVPATEVSLARDIPAIEIMISGVRHDTTGHRPRTREDGAAFGKPVPVESDHIASFSRELVLDDSAVRYRIDLERPVAFRLEGRRDPVRILVDLETDCRPSD